MFKRNNLLLALVFGLSAIEFYAVGSFFPFNNIQNFLVGYKQGLPKIFIIRSGSMSPGLPAGSVIAVKPQKEYNLGEVISFYSGNYIVTHRINKIVEENGLLSFQTKGDSNSGPDREPVKKTDIIGGGFYALPYFGYFLAFLKTRTGFLATILIPAILIVFGEILGIKNEIKGLVKGRNEKRWLPKLSLSVKSLLIILAVIIPVSYLGFSSAYFSDTEGSAASITTGTWGGEPTPPPGWDKSSLYFDEEYGCQGTCEIIIAKVCNGEDAEDMQGETTWEIYYIESGNPKNGEIVGSGTINMLGSGECQELEFVPTANGNYKFKAYQRTGHPGTGELWSETCEMNNCFVY